MKNVIDKNSFLNLEITPSNTPDTDLAQGHFPYMEEIHTVKTIYIIFGRDVLNTEMGVGGRDILKYLPTVGLKPCTNAPNYLIGLVAYLKENKIPELENGILISLDKSCCFDGAALCVECENADPRLYCVNDESPKWGTSFVGKWFFLAEEA